MQLTTKQLRDGSVWGNRPGEMDVVFEPLRADGPTFVDESVDGATRPGFYGYWALARHADIVEVSRRPKDFSSAKGASIDDVPREVSERTASFISMDDPEHTRLRRIVSRAFSPAALNRLRSDVEAIAAEVVSDIAERGECDFVTEVAVPVPTRVILDLMGISRSEQTSIVHNTNRILGAYEAEYVPDQTDAGRLKARLEATTELEAMAQDLARDRIKNPREDLVTMLVNGVEGDNMTPEEMSAFFSLLLLAGNETTRNAIAHGMLALTQFPEQRERWQSDFDEVVPMAVEEIVRWATPVTHMRRTVTADGVRLGDVSMSAGDKVVMWYYSANRDPAVFEDPLGFDVTRRPNDHLSFGAPGAHYCLGAHLARREIAVTFRELFRRLPDIEVSGPPQWLTSNFLNGIKHLPVRYTATAAHN